MTPQAWPDQRPGIEPSQHGWLHPTVAEVLASNLSDETAIVVEVGSWLGKSARFILDHAPHAQLYCIDTWQGSPEHQARPEWRDKLPTLYETFLSSCWDYRDRLYPVRMDSLDGLNLLAGEGVTPDLVYIDGDHSFAGAFGDVSYAAEHWPDAILVGDDYSRRDYPDVVRAVENFIDLNPTYTLTTHGRCWEARP